MFWQGSLFGVCAPEFDVEFREATRDELSPASWVELTRGWLLGADQLLDDLVECLPLRQRRGVRMFDQIVDEPRLSAWWSVASGAAEPLPILTDMRHVLADRYDEPFDSIGFNLYRDGHDSVAWHSDRHAKVVINPVVAIVSLGAPRPFRMRPKRGEALPSSAEDPSRMRRSGATNPLGSKGGRESRMWELGSGDLFVMGGASQHEWEHTVPKVRTTTGPRLSVSFRSW